MNLYQPIVEDILESLAKITPRPELEPAIGADQRAYALEMSMEENQQLIIREIRDILLYVERKIPVIEQLEQLNRELSRRAEQIRSEGVRPTVATDKRTPKAG